MTDLEQALEALRPFAEAYVDCIDDDEPDRFNTWEHAVGMAVTIGYYRRAYIARNALESAKGNQPFLSPDQTLTGCLGENGNRLHDAQNQGDQQ